MPIWKLSHISLEALQQQSKGTIDEHRGIEYLEIGHDYVKARMPVDRRTRQPMVLLQGLACGVPMDEASSRCMLLYAYVFGASLMIYEKFDHDVTRLKRDIADLIARSCHPSATAA